MGDSIIEKPIGTKGTPGKIPATKWTYFSIRKVLILNHDLLPAVSSAALDLLRVNFPHGLLHEVLNIESSLTLKVLEQAFLVLPLQQWPVALDAIELRRVRDVEDRSDVHLSVDFLHFLGFVHSQVVEEEHDLRVTVLVMEDVQEPNVLCLSDWPLVHVEGFKPSILTDACNHSMSLDLHVLVIDGNVGVGTSPSFL
jgi:hypothetical protein